MKSKTLATELADRTGIELQDLPRFIRDGWELVLQGSGIPEIYLNKNMTVAVAINSRLKGLRIMLGTAAGFWATPGTIIWDMTNAREIIYTPAKETIEEYWKRLYLNISNMAGQKHLTKCVRCERMTPEEFMFYDDANCHSCASEIYGIVF